MCCFSFDACFGCGRHGHEDFGREPSTPRHAAAERAHPTTYQPPARNGADHGQQRNGNQGQGYYGNGHKPSYQTAADEAGRKAYNDARKDHATVAGAAATRDGYDHAAYGQDKAYTYSAADETVRLPATARNNKVGDDTGYKARFYEPAAEEDTTGYHYPTTTTTIARNA